MTVALRAQVVLPYHSGLPRDVAVNTFNFFALTDPADPVAAIEEVRTRLNTFYDTVSPHLGAQLDPDNARIRFYGGDDFSAPLTFLEEDAMPTGPIGGEPYPAEVAICLSFAGESAIGGAPTNAQNRRGRVYLGPLDSAVGTFTASSKLIVDSTVTATIANAGNDLMDGVLSDGSFEWVVVSRALGGGIIPVSHGWCDNEFDTQRRRGLEASARTVFP